MKKLVAGVVAVVGVVVPVVLLSGPGQAQTERGAASAPSVQPRPVCEARRVGQDVEVAVRLQLTDRALDVARDEALVVADLGDVTQTRVLRPDTRRGAGYAVTFENLPADIDLSSISVRASRSPDDPASFACDSSAVAGPRVVSRGSLPQSGG